MKRQISVMIKPSSSNCNLRCEYCFYHSLARHRECFSHGLISDETMENVIKKALSYANGGGVCFTFQGGEPLLRGKDFFRNVKKMLAKYNTNGTTITLAMQTNGTLIDDEWCEIFKDYLVGVSLDGLGDINKYRIDAEGKETASRVLHGIELLKAHNIPFNVLSVVTRDVAINGAKVYDDFKNLGIKHLQFIPCLKPFGEPDIESEMYMSGREYGDFLWRIFKRYFNDFTHGNYISIRLFDNFVRKLAGGICEQCGMNGTCTRQFVIEGDGDVYPCDFYCVDEWRLGNINSDNFEDMEASDRANNFIKESIVKEDKCDSCDYYPICLNGCKRERSDIEKCEAYKYFFARALPLLKNLVPYA